MPEKKMIFFGPNNNRANECLFRKTFDKKNLRFKHKKSRRLCRTSIKLFRIFSSTALDGI